MTDENHDEKAANARAQALATLARSFDLERQRRAAWPQRANGDIDTSAAMVSLGNSFPTLVGVPGVDPFDAERLLASLETGGLCGGARRAAMFLLHVWNPQMDGGRGFNLSDALGVWDEAHRAAFLRWASFPFWP